MAATDGAVMSAGLQRMVVAGWSAEQRDKMRDVLVKALDAVDIKARPELAEEFLAKIALIDEVAEDDR
jgi:hypothetical protein